MEKLEFKVLTDADLDKFAEEVQKYLSQGWKFHGTIFLTQGSGTLTGYTYLHQAIVKGLE